MTTEQELKAFVTYLSTISIDPGFKPEEYGYESSVLICINAVLSIHRPYKSFVIPRVEYFAANYPHIKNLNHLAVTIQEIGYEGFNAVWNYQHSERVEILERLCLKFMDYAAAIGASNDLLAMRHWASHNSIADHRTFKVSGIGIVTYQYLRMLLGESTVKPDTHIVKACETVLGRRVSEIEAVMIVEEASEVIGFPAITIDNAIWNTYARS